MTILRWFALGHRERKRCAIAGVGPVAVLLLALAAGALAAEALDPARALTQYQNDRWQTEQGLPQSTIQARDGAVWAATNNGLVRWAKGATRVFRKADGLPTDKLRSVAFDRDGTLRIGTYTSGFARLKKGQITLFEIAQGLPGTDVRALCQNRAGTLWAATMTDLARFDGRGFVAVMAQSVPLDGIISMFEDHAGTLWFGTAGEGLVRLRDGEFRVLTTRDGLASNKVMAFHEDARGSPWIGTGGVG